jgi:hypothetical protein
VPDEGDPLLRRGGELGHEGLSGRRREGGHGHWGPSSQRRQDPGCLLRPTPGAVVQQFHAEVEALECDQYGAETAPPLVRQGPVRVFEVGAPVLGEPMADEDELHRCFGWE